MIPFLVHLAVVLARMSWVAPIERMPTDEAFQHGAAMVFASSREVSEYEIRRRAEHESGYWTDARPGKVYYVDGVKKIGKPRRWPHVVKKFPKLRHYICGVMQATAKTPAECVAWIGDIFANYRAGADSIRRWHEFCRRNGRTGKRRYACARAGYSEGTDAALSASIRIWHSAHGQARKAVPLAMWAPASAPAVNLRAAAGAGAERSRCA